MNRDISSVDERDDEDFETFDDLPELAEQPDVEQNRPATIIAEGLSKYFSHKGGLVKAVDNVSFTFTESQFVTIIGPSGSGKSTLLYLIGGLDEATGGRLLVDDTDVTALSEWQQHLFRRQKLGFIFQSFHLLSNLTALENVMLPMQLAGEHTHEEMRARASELLVEVGMSEDRHDHKPGKLSGGQQQRVAIARALANDPRVILADEPTGNLDSRMSRRIIDLLKKLAEQGKTVIVVTHDRSITKIADVRMEMIDGKLQPMPRYAEPTAVSTRASRKKSWEDQPATIVAAGVSKHFKVRGKVVKAVDEVNFTFTEGQFVTITGASGSGKSTLLYILSGLDKATKGELLVDNINVRSLAGRKEDRFRRQRLGFIFQSFHLLPNLTALENVMLPMQMLHRLSRTEMRERARMLLFQVGINEDRHSHTPGKLSGGQQQRVAIARALANDPRVILADEPTGNLDSYNGKRIVELLKTLAEEGKTVVVVTHDRSIARDADVRMELVDGRIKNAVNTGVPAPALLVTNKKKQKKK